MAKKLTLAELRAKAYKAHADHEHDIKTDPEYKAYVDRKTKRDDAAARREGRVYP